MPCWTPPDWRDTEIYAPVLAGGRPALAWELLRRDPAYREDCAGAGASSDVGSRWGLHFRG
jgi:hypothetical protein